MKNIISHIWLVLLLLSLQEESFAQIFIQPNSPLTNTLSGNSSFNYEHGQEIVFDPDFEYTPNSPNGLEARINEKLFVPDISYAVNPQVYATNRQLNTSLKVGGIEGIADVMASGLATYTIPVFTAPGTGGMVPSVQIQYLSQKEGGLLGYGWDISGLTTITRSGNSLYFDGSNTGVSFTNADAFLLEGQRLLPVTGANGAVGTIYDTENASFSQIISKGTAGTGPDWFLIKTKEGLQIEVGNSSDSKLSHNGTALIWKVNRIMDANGNFIRFSYRNDGNEILIDKIEYTGNDRSGLAPYNSLEFFYTKRQDVLHKYVNGKKLTSSLVLSKIESMCEGNMARRLSFSYLFDQYTKLMEIKESDGFNTSKNSTLVLWEQRANTVTESYNPDLGKIFTKCDANGDGKPDYVVPQNIDAYNYTLNIKVENPQTGRYTIYSLPGGLAAFDKTLLPSPFITAYDFNQDGNEEIYVRIRKNQNGTEFFQYYGYEYNKTSNSFVQLPASHFITQVVIPAIPNTPDAQDMTYIIPTDINGDGISEASFYRKSQGTAMIFEIRQDAPAAANFTSLFNFTNTAALAGIISDVQVMDFNGDGKTDYCFYQGGAIEISTLNPSGGGLQTIITTHTGICEDNDLRYWADFNGDGNSDLLVREIDNNGETTNWLVYYSDGRTLIPQTDMDEVFRPFGWRAQPDVVELQDFNNDRKTDILFGFKPRGTPAFPETYVQQAYMNVYYSNGSGFAKLTKPHLADQVRDYILDDIVLTDLNGDGICDAYVKVWAQNTFGYDYAKVLFDYDEANSYTGGNAVRSITNGLNLKTTFEYKNIKESGVLTQWGSNINFSPNTVYVYDPNATPAVAGKIKYLLNTVVKAMNTEHHNSGKVYDRTEYQYTNAIYSDMKGFGGFTGFTKTYFRNGTERSRSVTTNGHNNTYEESYPITTVTYLNGNISPGSTAYWDYQFTGLGGKRFKRLANNTGVIDHVNGTTTATASTYDNYGNVVSSYTSNGFSNVTVDNTYISVGSFCDNKIASQRIQKNVNGDPAVIPSAFTYDSYGNMLTSTAFDGMVKSVITTYTYNASGSPLSKVVSASGLPSVSEHYTYDSRSRFVVEHYNTLGQKTEMSYQPYSGKVLQEKNIGGLTTRYEYDGWGNMLRSTDALGTVSTVSLGWSNPNADENKYYYSSVQKPGTPGKITCYDIFGRSRKETSRNPAGNPVSLRSDYDDDGYLFQKSKPYIEGNSPVFLTYTYDNGFYGMGRLQQISDPETGKTFSYTYAAKSIVVAESSGTGTISQVSKQFNDDGSLGSLTDLAGGITYAYNGFGKVRKIEGIDSKIELEYDEYGRPSQMKDDDAGTVTYLYNAYGQLQAQSNAEGTTFQMNYDNMGRITSKVNQTTGLQTTYTYVSTGNGLNQVQSSSGWDGTTQNFTYDNYHRLISSTETVSGETFVTSYAYNSMGQPSQVTYPSDFALTRAYNNYGFCTSITENTNNTLIWQASTYDEYGQPLEELLAGNYKLVKTYEKGGHPHFSSFMNPNNTPLLQREYNFDFGTGNLSNVSDPLKGLQEQYQYDQMQRLTVASLWNGSEVRVAYTANGNIDNKTDVSAQSYQYNKQPHAVSDIPEPEQVIPSFTQEVHYNTDGLVQYIIEDNRSLQFTYGPDDLRRKTRLEDNNNNSVTTHYYIGEYEKVISGSGSKELHYIYSPNGLLGVMIKRDANQQFLYAHTDYLGSIMALVNADNGSVVEEFNTDAWGKRRNPNDWTYNNVPVPQTTNRCFTGHEHLDLFGLIHMNARLYDPVISRMLGPDNFVQDPENTQSLNRYAYAFNNPLIYIDPTGNTNIGRGIEGFGTNPSFNQQIFLDAYEELKAYADDAEVINSQMKSGGSVNDYDQDGNPDGVDPEIAKYIAQHREMMAEKWKQYKGQPQEKMAYFIPFAGPIMKSGAELVAGNYSESIALFGIAGMDLLTFGEASAARLAAYGTKGIYVGRIMEQAARRGEIQAAKIVEDAVRYGMTEAEVMAATRAGKNVVYTSVEKGVTQYVGITNDLARRAAEHLASKGIKIEPLMAGLSRTDARAVEQALIEIHGLGRNGGTLLNRINSISPSNPIYGKMLQRGYDLLNSIGYK